MAITANDLDAATACLVSTLGQAAERDWTAASGTAEHTAWTTAEHLGDCLMSYAAQLVARPDGRYVRFAATVDKDAVPVELLEFVVAGAGMLSAVVRAASPSARAYHPSGVADPEGFAGMGCVEVLVHGEDIARGLGLAIDPPRDVCERVLARMFPTIETGTVDPWTALLWATDRIQVPGSERQIGWRWRGEPLDE